MAYCPNIDCPHRKRTGNPAEFMEGVTHCSDCGAELIAASLENESLVQEKTGFSDLTMRILFTLGMIAVWQLLSRIPVYGLDHEALESSFAGGVLGVFGLAGRLRIGALGIMPYLTAYMLVELAALFVPKLKAWRAGGPHGRSSLRRLALFATFIIAFLQGYGVVTGIELMADGAFVLHPGIMFRLITILTMTAVVFLLVWISDLVTKRGIGHGISILIGSGIVVGYFLPWSYSQGLQMISEAKQSFLGGHPPLYPIVVKALFAIFIMIALFVLVAFIERYHKKIPVMLNDGKDAYIPLKLTAAGIVPASLLAPILLSLLAILLGTFGSWSMQRFTDFMTSGGTAYFIVFFFLILLLYFILSAQFYNSEKLSAFVSERNAQMTLSPGADVESIFDNKLKHFAILGALYLNAIVILNRTLFWNTDAVVLIGGLALIKLVVISMDVWGEFKARRQFGKLMKVSECHDVPKAGYLKSVLETHGIPCHVQGYYHRALYYIFGPYLEMPVLVPEEKHGEAVELVEKYFH